MPQDSPTVRTRRWRSARLKSMRVDGAVLRFGFTRTQILDIRVWLGERDDGGRVPLQFTWRLNRAAAWSENTVSFSGDRPLNLEVQYVGEDLDLLGVTWLAEASALGEGRPVRLSPEWVRGLEGPNRELLAGILRVDSEVASLDQFGLVAPITEGDPADANAVVDQLLLLGTTHDDDLPPLPSGHGCPGTPPNAPFDGNGSELEQQETRALFEQRRAAIALRARVDCFFLTFDSLSDQMLTRGVAVRKLSPLLGDRVNQRRELGRCALRATFLPHDQQEEISLRTVAAWFDQALSASGLGEEHVGFAFELFVSGRLSVVHPEAKRRAELATHGTTNSSMYFQFPEVALALARHPVGTFFSDADRARWVGRAGHMIRAAHLLTSFRWNDLRVIPGSGDSPTLTPYRYFDGFSMSFRRIEAFRAGYEAAEAAWGASSTDELCEAWEDVYGRILAIGAPPCASGPGVAMDRGLPHVEVPPLIAIAMGGLTESV